MATIKKTLLEIVQDILNDMDSDKVNSISDTVEAEQIAQICQSVFYDVITTVVLPEHDELLTVTGLGDNTKPNFMDANSVTKIKELRYNVSDTSGQLEYKLIPYVIPTDFIQNILQRDTSASNVIIVTDPTSGISLPVINDKMPDYYTTFDDRYLCFDSYQATVDTTLQTSKTLVIGTKLPSFTITNSAVPDMDDTIFPYYIAECKSRAFSVLKGGPDPKIEQFARKHRYFQKNDRSKVQQENIRNGYGRNRK
jgi:hypothetical protein